MIRLHRFFLVIAVLSATNCYAQNGLKGLQDYLKTYKYVTFVPPRQNVSVGTIVNYSSGFESVVSSKCIPADKVKATDPAPVGLTDRTGTLDRTVGFEGSFARALDPHVDLKGAYNDVRVQKISIEITDPTESHIESNDLKEYVATLQPGSQCARTMTNRKNRVLESLLEIKGITYSFYDKDGKKISLDATLLTAIKLSPSYHRDFENKDSLKLDKPIFIGYRAWKVTSLPGAVKPKIELEESGPGEIADLKGSAKKGSPGNENPKP
jgi:hypothetical protein